MQGPWGLPEGVLEGSQADLQVLDPRGVGVQRPNASVLPEHLKDGDSRL